MSQFGHWVSMATSENILTHFDYTNRVAKIAATLRQGSKLAPDDSSMEMIIDNAGGIFIDENIVPAVGRFDLTSLLLSINDQPVSKEYGFYSAREAQSQEVKFYVDSDGACVPVTAVFRATSVDEAKVMARQYHRFADLQYVGILIELLG